MSDEGQPRINLNEPDLRLLEGQLRQVFDPRWAEFIIQYRQFGAADGQSRLQAGVPATLPPPAVRRPPRGARPAPGGTNDAGTNPPAPALTSRPDRDPLDILRPQGPNSPPAPPAGAGPANRASRRFPGSAPAGAGGARGKPIGSALDLIGVQLRVPQPAGGPPRIVDSPFTNDRAAMREYLPRLLSQTTADAEKVVRGRSMSTWRRAWFSGPCRGSIRDWWTKSSPPAAARPTTRSDASRRGC